FFSSRRRHTSFSRDWSSDVCSSDLLLGCISHRFEIAFRELKLDEELLNLLLYLLGFGVAFGLSHPLVKLANGMKCILEFYRSIVPILKAVYFVDEQSSFT